jgi:hypothetical protein
MLHLVQFDVVTNNNYPDHPSFDDTIDISQVPENQSNVKRSKQIISNTPPNQTSKRIRVIDKTLEILLNLKSDANMESILKTTTEEETKSTSNIMNPVIDKDLIDVVQNLDNDTDTFIENMKERGKTHCNIAVLE